MKNNFNGREINLGAVSVYHGLIAVGSSDKSIYIWDYEFAKLLIEINLPSHYDSSVETTSIAFINGYSILVIGTSIGELHLVKLIKLEFMYSVEHLSTYKSH